MTPTRTLSTFRTHYPTASNYQTSIFYFWFEFLKRSDRESQSKQVQDDFGDVSEIQFMDWWFDIGVDLFGCWELSDHAIVGVTSLEAAQTALDGGRFLVGIDMSLPKSEIMKRLQTFVDNRANNKVGRRSFKPDTDSRYSVKSKFDIKSLEKILEVYDFSIKYPHLTNWQMEEELFLIDKTSKDKDSVWRMGNTPYELAIKHKIQTATVSRYLRHARNIIENVAQGVFPVQS